MGKRIYPQFLGGVCFGCTCCVETVRMFCPECKAEQLPLRGQRDFLIVMVANFMCEHRAHMDAIEGLSDKLPYSCNVCSDVRWGVPQHSVECINYWNRLAMVWKTGQDGSFLRSEMGR